MTTDTLRRRILLGLPEDLITYAEEINELGFGHCPVSDLVTKTKAQILAPERRGTHRQRATDFMLRYAGDRGVELTPRLRSCVASIGCEGSLTLAETIPLSIALEMGELHTALNDFLSSVSTWTSLVDQTHAFLTEIPAAIRVGVTDAVLIEGFLDTLPESAGGGHL